MWVHTVHGNTAGTYFEATREYIEKYWLNEARYITCGTSKTYVQVRASYGLGMLF